MRFDEGANRGRILDLDITPMIDVVFLLIIFFMTTAQFARMTRANLDLPVEPGEEELRRSAGLVVNVSAGGEYIVDGQTVSLERVLGMVRAELATAGDAEAVELSIRADRRARAGAVNRLAEELTSMGVRSWRLATEVPR